MALSSPKDYDVKIILERLEHYGVDIALGSADELVVEFPDPLDQATCNRIQAVLKQHKTALLIWFDTCQCGTYVQKDDGQGCGSYSQSGKYVCSQCLAAQPEPEPEPPTLEEIKARFSSLGKQLEYPQVQYSPCNRLCEGQEAWSKFAEMHDAFLLSRIIALVELQTEVQKTAS